MGTQFSFESDANDPPPPPKKPSHQIKTFIKSKLFKNKNGKQSTSTFFLKHNQSNQNTINNISSLDQRRVIFISLMGLFSTWNNVPSVELYSSIFILPLKKKWIYFPVKYKYEIKTSFVGKYTCFYQDRTRTEKFIELLQWKDSQGLLVWMLDNYDIKSININMNCMIHAVWYHLSNKLVKLYDPVTNANYKALHFDVNWWKNVYNKHKNHLSLYDNTVVSIMNEYYVLTMHYRSMQEIIHQSNPKSFNIVVSYANHCGNNINRMIKVQSIKSMFQGDDNSVSNGQARSTWFISSDYDPYDM